MTIVNLRERLLHLRHATGTPGHITDARAEFYVSCIMQQEK